MTHPGPGASCRWCRGRSGETVLDLGGQPAVDVFPRPGDPRPPIHPLQLWRCDDCGLAQLPAGAPALDEPTAVEPQAVVEHGRTEVARLVARGAARAGSTIREFASPHGGSWSGAFAAAGLIPVLGGRADLVVDNVGLMHADDLAAATAQRVSALAAGGTLVLVFPPLDTLVSTGAWYGVRHAHFTYPSTAVAAATLSAHGLVVVDLHTAPLWGGTVTLVATREVGDAIPLPPDVDPADLRTWNTQVGNEVAALRGYLEHSRAIGHRVLGYGAASRSIPLLGAAGIGPDLLPAIADAAPVKQGRVLPAGGIPVISPAQLVAAAPDEVILFLPDLLPEVRRSIPGVEVAGGRWVDVADLLGGRGHLPGTAG